MNILVSTDTSCLVSNDAFKNYDISVFPLNVIINGEEFLDGVTINQEQLKEAMRSGKNIKTSTPPLGLISEYFEDLFKKGYDHIIHFTISSKLSSMNELFKNVAKEFDGKITIIDSLAVSMPMLNYVFYAYEQAKAGVSPQEIATAIETFKQDSKAVFIPENLTALKNGGRISPSATFVGNLLGIKPVIALADGELSKQTITRRERRYFIDYISQIVKEKPVDKYEYSLVSFDANQRNLQSIYEHMDTAIGAGKYITGIIPINVCAHCGPGTIGLTIAPKINVKPLKDYLN